MFKVEKKCEAYRVRKGPMASTPEARHGALLIPPRSNVPWAPSERRWSQIVFDDGKLPGADPSEVWEHVSLTCFRYLHSANTPTYYVPTWEEMCATKDLFWDDEDVVVQFHPAKSEYVNVHEHVLHLWRLASGEFAVPPTAKV